MARAAEIALAISLAEAADTYRVDEGAMCAGADRLERGGADGTPLISEFLASELGPLLGLSPAATGWRIADTLNLRHRHPQLWRAFVGGEVRWWPALQVARRCAEAHLGVEAARFVDRQVAAALAVQPLGRVLRNLDRLIVVADPALARQRADEAAAFRAVGVGPARDGHVALWGTLDAADGLALDEALDAIADAMPAEVPRGHRRAAGLGELARGAFGQDPLPRHVVDRAPRSSREPGRHHRRGRHGAARATRRSAGGVEVHDPPDRRPARDRGLRWLRHSRRVAAGRHRTQPGRRVPVRHTAGAGVRP